MSIPINNEPMDLQCPLCLENLRQPILFPCCHACCGPCYIASGISICPYCRQAITTTEPAPWLDTNSFDSDSNSSEFREQSEDKCEIVDSRGYQLLDLAYRIRNCSVPIVSCVDEILQMKELEMSNLNRELQEKIRLLHQEHEVKVHQLQDKVNQLLDQDETTVKQQEYHNQGLEHLALTCQALSTQSTKVLNQAIPVYQNKIDEVLFDWPFCLSPLGSMKTAHSLTPTNLTPTKLTSCSIAMPHKLYTYVPAVNQFVYADGTYLCLGTRRINLKGHIRNIKVSNKSNIYVLRSNGLGRSIVRYNTELELIVDIIEHSYIRNFFIADDDDNGDNDDEEVIPVYQNGLFIVTFTYKGQRYSHSLSKKYECFNGNIHVSGDRYKENENMYTHNCDDFFIHQGQIYFIEKLHGNTVLSRGSIETLVRGKSSNSNSSSDSNSNSSFGQSSSFGQNQGLAVVTHEGSSGSLSDTVKKSKIIGVNHIDFDIVTQFEFPKHGKFYPSAKNTVIYCCDGYGEIFTL